MSLWVDTHAHLDGLRQGDSETPVAEALSRAFDAGVTRIIAVGGNPDGNRFAIRAAHQFAGVRAAAGFDRYCATRQDLDENELETQLSDPALVALGEIGLDYHYDPGTAMDQERLFNRMLDRAADRLLPVIVHCREAEARMGPLLEGHARRWKGATDRIGVIHCFTGTPDFARLALGLGFHISFSGILTFSRAENVRNAAAVVPPDRLLVETDTPYLAPVPHRGRPNEPMFAGLVCDCLAQIKNTDPGEMAALTTANAKRLFNLS
jgi:TatD DNase family protein